ncbi:MAG TPA: SMP-30/gluconolactonase/LRE family protein [Alphaproteobacteria bacterium]|nr:SMP-30/gluconolactonase/LRE family protein [Alphaproteobacteria bacterium]
MSEVTLVVDARNELGEGPVWSPRHRMLFWTDIQGRALWRHEPATGRTELAPLPQRLGCYALTADGGALGAFADGLRPFDPLTGAAGALIPVEADRPTTRFNDGRTDRQGRLVAGTLNESADREPIAAVYRVDADLGVTRLFGGVRIANGLCFSPDGRTLYFADTILGTLDAFDYDPATGTPSNRRTLVAKGALPGGPDGAVVDAEGFIWNARFGGGCIARIAPDGRIDRVVAMPVSQPTCPAFGGDDLETLYVTTAWEGMDAAARAAEPQAGGLFAFTPGVRGLPEPLFAGRGLAA